MPGREDAYRLMTDHVKNENLQKHMLSVEAAMRFYARKYGEDEELWAMTGLLHDCDYEEYPDLHDHTLVAARWLQEGGYDERIIYAILAHNDLNLATHPRNDLLSKGLYACDEVTGMIMATVPVRPINPGGFVGTIEQDGQIVNVAAIAFDDGQVALMSLIGCHLF